MAAAIASPLNVASVSPVTISTRFLRSEKIISAASRARCSMDLVTTISCCTATILFCTLRYRVVCSEVRLELTPRSAKSASDGEGKRHWELRPDWPSPTDTRPCAERLRKVSFPAPVLTERRREGSASTSGVIRISVIRQEPPLVVRASTPRYFMAYLA